MFQEIYFYILIKDLTHNEQTYILNLFKGKHVKKENEEKHLKRSNYQKELYNSEISLLCISNTVLQPRY
jgi:hypothetical protein